MERRTTVYDVRQLSRIRLEEHTKIFASMCPDEILDYYDDYETREYYTTLMLGDVSGFTDLTEKYTTAGRGGPSKLTETLNSYIGAMVQEILSHNGDVLKFSGDAFIVMWKLKEGMIMRDIAIEAIQTACIIQKHFGTYDTDVGVTLRVKLSIASGKTYFTSIGDPETTSYYLITGKPVWDVKYAEGICRGGDILVAPSSWQWANPNEYIYEKLPNGIHTLILACSSMWYQSRTQEIGNNNESNGYKRQLQRDEDLRDSVSSDNDTPTTEAEAALMNLTGNTLKIDKFKQVDYSLRPKIIKVAKAHMKNALRSYMLRPVVRSVEMDEPLEHLTEMRQVVILFVNIITADIGKDELISLVNETYKLVCKSVGETQGCVNKTSLFDKDLIFLCIFGLRGDKHELESQVGLKCASKVRQDLLATKNIRSVTIAVTTGMTYCGVVGHILRREYTVIGMPVNRAARLMCAYSNKVVCDRETFLRSHLEARHFILQEPRYLKGITSIGPVYEFQEQAKYTLELTWSKYPLLGREEEISIFEQMITKLIDYFNMDQTTQYSKPEYNVLIIKGEPRMGKTRLLNEIAQNIPTGILWNYISLITDNAKTSYSLIHLIFSMPLGFNSVTTLKEREDKLICQLGHIRQPEFLCALNQPFNVRFTITEPYKALSKTEKLKVLRKFLLKLMKGCFKELWIIMIDNAEYSDDNSMLLFRTMVKQNTIFFVLSVGRKLGIDYELHPAVLEKAQIIELHYIDKWYHAALACQILNVRGIPAELEKLIQEKSFGNPGWIESYLVSLLQSGGLIIVNIYKMEAEDLGYVLPSISMLKRLATKDIFMNMEDDEERSDRWRMYRTSFRDLRFALHSERIDRESEMTADATIAVCKFAETFVPEEGHAEVTMEIITLKLFDSLTPLDQLLLKCASVLGEIVNRKMLENLMEETSIREIGLAIKKLFEIQIFSCEVGDFTVSSGPLIFYRNIRNFNIETEVVCQCIGLTIPEELADLPRYASCGLMRFKMSMFRETIYRLLTENQKMELHNKALKYLWHNTRRCMTCGELPFIKLLGKTTAQEIKRKSPTIEHLLDIQRFEKATATFKEETKSDAKQLTKERTRTCLDIFRKVDRKPTKTFSNIDFTNCQCHLILTTVYTQMLEHCHGIGKTNTIITVIVEFVDICLANYNIPQARRLLDDAKSLLHEMVGSSEEELIILPYLTGKIQTLQGRCYLESGLISEAEKKLKEAISILGYHFPRHKFMIDLKTIIQLKLLKQKLVCPKYWKIDTVDEYTTNYVEQLANCLTQMFDVFRTKGMKKHARLAAIWSLNSMLRRDSSKNFFALCASFTNMMITAHVYQNKSIISYLENEALKLCLDKEDSLEFQELQAIAELYAGVFFSRWLRGEIHKAIRIGFIVTRMAQTISSVFLKLLVLPRLVHMLMISCRHSEVVALLRELEFTSQNDLDKSGRTWYYALCADAQLDTGITILSFRNCEKYYLQEGETIISLRDPEAERRYFTSMWLWCVRMQQWEASKIWNSRNITAESVVDEHIVAVTITTLKKLEGLLILYVREVTGRNINATNTMAEIKNFFKYVEKMMKIVKIAIPRYMLLKAYYYMIQSRKRAAMKMLQQTKKLSLKVDNRMIYAWATHCQQAWLGIMSSIHKDLWKEKSDIKLKNGWDEVNANDSTMIPFTFPLPRYVL